MLKSYNIFFLIEMFGQGGGYNVLHGFTEDTGERNRPVICRVCFVSFFEEGADLGLFPLCRNYTAVQ